MGVTGVRAAVSDAAQVLVARTRAVSRPARSASVSGVSNGEQAAEVGEFADGVIVGSALVRCLRADSPDGRGGRGRALTAELAAGVRRVPQPS